MPDGSPGAERPDRFPLLDPLRGLAAVSILIVHAAIFSRAFDDGFYGRLFAHLDIGVAFFFLLSAFLLYRPFVAARVEGRERTGFGEYAKRRFVRIAPAYWAALTVAAIVPGFAGTLSGNWWVYYGLLQNYPVYTPGEGCASAFDLFRCGMPVAWSLTIEVLFYAMLPLLVLAMARFNRNRTDRWIWPELGFVAVLAGISFVIQSRVPTTDLQTVLFFSPLGRGWWFGLGLALAAISVRIAQLDLEPQAVGWLRRHPGPPVLAAVALYAIAAYTFLEPGPSLAFPVGDLTTYVAQYALFGVIAALILLPAIFGKDGGGLTRRVLGHRWLAWMGLVSYGIFLWQFPALVVVFDAGIQGFVPLTVLTFALTLVCATASYYLLELPLMRRIRKKPAVAGPASGHTSVGA